MILWLKQTQRNSRPEVCFHLFGQITQDLIFKAGNSQYPAEKSLLSHSADIKLHLPPAQMASNLCSEHYSPCRAAQSELCSQHLCTAQCSHLPSQGTWVKTWDYLTLLLHIHTMHKGRRGAHKHLGQFALGHVCTVRKEKQARNHFYQGQDSLEHTLQLLPSSHTACAKIQSLGWQLLGQPRLRDSTSSPRQLSPHN